MFSCVLSYWVIPYLTELRHRSSITYETTCVYLHMGVTIDTQKPFVLLFMPYRIPVAYLLPADHTQRRDLVPLTTVCTAVNGMSAAVQRTGEKYTLARMVANTILRTVAIKSTSSRAVARSDTEALLCRCRHCTHAHICLYVCSMLYV